VTLNGGTSATVTQGVTQNLVTTVLDTNGLPITGLTLDYQSTNQQTITVGGAGAIQPTFPGETSIYAICQPGTCNPAPINQVGLFGTGLSISSNAVDVTTPGTASSLVWFGAPGQSQYVVSYNALTNSLSSTVRLPYVPNSMVMDKLGTTLYFGSSRALMTVSTAGNALGTANTAVPGVVLAVSPTNSQILINDQARKVFYLFNTSGSVAGTFTGVGAAAQYTPDGKTLYVVDSTAANTSANANHTDTLYVYNVNTGWTTYDLTSSGGGTSVALAIPSVGAYIAGNPTVAHTWCPSGTVGDYTSLLKGGFYPQGDSVQAQTQTLAATADGQHIIGATLAGSGAEISDIGVSIPSTPVTPSGSKNAVPLPCPEDDSTTPATLLPLNLTHTLNRVGVSGINATAINQLVASPSSNLSFLTYTGTTPEAKLPFYTPGSGGTAGTPGYVIFTGSSAVTAPVAGAFSLDNQLFFTSTSGDNLIHIINTSTMKDTQQLNPNLPACTPGSDPDCTLTTTPANVPATAIWVKPRSTT
jgi:hypothetical protein